MDKLIEKSEAISLSDQDLFKIAGEQVKVLTYEQLEAVSTIEELLNPYGAVIILYQLEEGSGHWVSLFRVDEKVEFFDSYGLGVDEELKFSKYNMRKLQGQSVPHLSALLHSGGYVGSKLIQNTIQLQEFKKESNTCGRYAAYRVLHRHLPLSTFVHLLTENKYYNPDFWISIATLHLSDHVYNIIEN